MDQDLLDLYDHASAWTAEKVVAASSQLDSRTPCKGWDVRQLMNHMLDTQRYFTGAAKGTGAPVPSSTPPDLLGDDPVAEFEQGRVELMRAYAEPGVIERTGPTLGIAFSDQLLHGWDLATATGQDATMPAGLADAAYEIVHDRFTDDQRRGIFGPEVPVDAGASPQDRYLAYTGRDPSSPFSAG
jgi:uncharacterized protein (TIGR03086 family)